MILLFGLIHCSGLNFVLTHVLSLQTFLI